MGVVITVVIQNLTTAIILNRRPNLIPFFQIQRQLDGQRTMLISDGASFNRTPPN